MKKYEVNVILPDSPKQEIIEAAYVDIHPSGALLFYDQNDEVVKILASGTWYNIIPYERKQADQS